MSYHEHFKRAVIYRIRAEEKKITTIVVEILRMNSQMTLHAIAKIQWQCPLISGSVSLECVCGKCSKAAYFRMWFHLFLVSASKRRGEQSHADWVRWVFCCVCLMHWNHFYHRMHVSATIQNRLQTQRLLGIKSKQRIKGSLNVRSRLRFVQMEEKKKTRYLSMSFATRSSTQSWAREIMRILTVRIAIACTNQHIVFVRIFIPTWIEICCAP